MKKILVFVSMLLLLTSFGWSQGLGLKQVGGSLGYVSISFTSGTTTETLGGFAVAAHAYLGDITPGLGLYPEIQYFSTSKDIGGGTWKLSDFAINANVHYNIAMEGENPLTPYVGAGLGYNSLSSEVTITLPFFGTMTASGSDSRLGINLLAGANYKLNENMTLFVEPRYVLASDFNHFLAKVGVSYTL